MLPAYLLALPIIMWSVWIYVYSPHPVPAAKQTTAIAGIIVPIALVVIAITITLWRQFKKRDRSLFEQGFKRADEERTRLVRTALSEEIGIGARGVRCWARDRQDSVEYFAQFITGSGGHKERMFAIKIRAARAPYMLRCSRISRASMLIQRRIVPPVGPDWFARHWVVMGHPDMTEIMFSEELCQALEDPPPPWNRTWVWRYDQLWLIAKGVVTAHAVKICFERAALIAQVAGITPGDNTYWDPEMFGEMQQDPSEQRTALHEPGG